MHIQFIQRGIDYIEENLFQPVSLEECARAAGYSLYHYCRVFTAAMGIPVKEYIRRRRVSESVRMINETSLSLKEIGYRCGFNSQENYIRVFRAVFGISPAEYKRTRYPMLLTERKSLPDRYLKEPDYNCFEEPQLVSIDSFKVAGRRFPTSFEHERQFQDVPIFWDQYYAERLYERLGYTGEDPRIDHGVSILGSDTSDLYDGDNQRKCLDFDYLTGVRVPAEAEIPEELDSVVIPSGLYAAFHHRPATDYNLIQNLIDTWRYIDFYWLPNSSYEHAGNLEFNEYHPGRDRLSKTIYIPIRPKP